MAQKETKRRRAVATAAVDTAPDWSSHGMAGFENVNQEDLGIPFLTILQKGNPQVDRDHVDYATKKIDGAEIGDIINSVANVVVASAGEELEFIPCSYQRLYMEWVPRAKGGGLVKTHKDASILNECVRNELGQDVLRNNNIIVTTAYFYGIALLDGAKTPVVIGLSSTQLKKAKMWLNMMMTLKLAKPDGTKYTPPMFSHTYLLSSTPEKNEKGTWRGWLIHMGKMVTDSVLIAASIDYAKRASTQVRATLNAPPAEDKSDDVL